MDEEGVGMPDPATGLQTQPETAEPVIRTVAMPADTNPAATSSAVG